MSVASPWTSEDTIRPWIPFWMQPSIHFLLDRSIFSLKKTGMQLLNKSIVIKVLPQEREFRFRFPALTTTLTFWLFLLKATFIRRWCVHNFSFMDPLLIPRWFSPRLLSVMETFLWGTPCSEWGLFRKSFWGAHLLPGMTCRTRACKD